jgi:hypothetical protein
MNRSPVVPVFRPKSKINGKGSGKLNIFFIFVPQMMNGEKFCPMFALHPQINHQ